MSAERIAIRFHDPAGDFRELGPELNDAINRVLAEGDYIRGRAVAEFEEAFARFLGVYHAVGVASGTDALHLALRAAGIGPGDEVITAPNTFTATAMAIVHAGARPALADIEPETMNLDPSRLEEKLTPRTRAVIPVHLYGLPAAMAEIMELAGRRGLVVIEDACQAHGAEYCGQSAGAIGLVGAFSFYPTKNLGGVGDGGMAATNSRDLAEKIRMLANYGSREKDRHEFVGMNSRLDSIQAAALKVKLARLREWNRRRQEHADLYRVLLAASPLIRLPAVMPDRSHVYHQFVIRVPAGVRSLLRERLRERGIPTMIHYPAPIHLQPAFSFLGQGPGSFPVAEAAAEEMISLPVHQHLTEPQIREAAAAILSELERLKAPGSELKL